MTRLCDFPDCGRMHSAHGYCVAHNYHRRRGESLRPIRPARKSGSHRLTPGGYVAIWDGERERLEHRTVMENEMDRPLAADETVHHRNGVKTDNRIANLELWSSRHVRGARVEDLVQYAVEILERYAPSRIKA